MGKAQANSSISRDETFKESISHGNDEYPFAYYYEDVWDFDFHCVDWHWHPEIEIVYLMSGSMTVLIGSDRLVVKSGEVLFINSGIIHRFEADEHAVIPNMVFSPELLAEKNSLIYKKYIRPVIQDFNEYKVFSADREQDAQVVDIINSIFEDQRIYTENDCPNELETAGKLMHFWQLLYRSFKNEEGKREGINDRSVGKQAKLQMMMQFIQNNYKKQIGLDDVADSVLISKSSALKLFDEYLHMPPIKYLISYRLKCAARLLTTTENSVMTIAMETGFGDSAYFCRKFKEAYGQTPSEYRKREMQ